jgi:DNA (cytosine-5)-methyltransferase 1
MSNRWRGAGGLADARLDLLTPTRERLLPLAVPWVIENVAGARTMMRATLRLAGGMFGLGVDRPRLFESNVLVMAPEPVRVADPIGVYGKAHDGRRLFTRKDGSIQRAAGSLEAAKLAMGVEGPIDWDGLREAIPPAYTEWIGRQLLAAIEDRAA